MWRLDLLMGRFCTAAADRLLAQRSAGPGSETPDHEGYGDFPPFRATPVSTATRATASATAFATFLSNTLGTM